MYVYIKCIISNNNKIILMIISTYKKTNKNKENVIYNKVELFW